MISADNEFLGEERQFLGIFDGYGITTFKSVVVEFDLYRDQGSSPPTYDISDNHVSFDFSNITTVAANASNVGVELWNNITTYAWVDYSDEARQLEVSQLEVRVSNNKSRPTSPLLKHTLNLSEVVEEYMWVGFSAGSGDYYSNYNIGDWSFQSSGIPSYSSSVRTRLSKADGGDKLGFPVGIAVGVPTLLLACIFIGIMLHRKFTGVELYRTWSIGRRGYSTVQLEPREELEQVRVFRYQELIEATNGFTEENWIGGGGFGAVYRGVLSDNTQVAVNLVH